jgi:hypothetical protein
MVIGQYQARVMGLWAAVGVAGCLGAPSNDGAPEEVTVAATTIA